MVQAALLRRRGNSSSNAIDFPLGQGQQQAAHPLAQEAQQTADLSWCE
jgi:hypothetical protein